MLTDIDDTLTRAGQIEPVALRALQTLQARGVPVPAITGRPVGWSEPFASAWPVMGIVAESGSVCLSVKNGKLHKRYAQVVQLMRAHGLTAPISSIHINGSTGTHDKFSGTGFAEVAEWVLAAKPGAQP